MTLHGTLILAALTRHGAYLAADSRSTGPELNSVQKVFQCGSNAFVGITGHLVARGQTIGAQGQVLCDASINIMEILRHFSSEYSGDGTDLVDRVTRRIYDFLAGYWMLVIRPSRDSFLASYPNVSEFCEIPILGRIGGAYNLVSIHFPLSADGRLLKPSVQDRFEGADENTEYIIAFGKPVDGEGIEADFRTSEGVLATMAALYRKAIAAHQDTVGEPIDIGFLDENGARWIATKLNLDQFPASRHEGPEAV
jgi:hypothetical protein